MKKLTLLFALVACYIFSFAQSPKYFLDNSLTFKRANNSTIPYPFMGGFISPQFSNIDLNGDGKKDLFVFDRATNKVLTFLNAQGPMTNWVYAPDYEMGFPSMHSWALLADYNGDGKEDIFTAADANLYPQAIAVYKNVSVGNNVKFQLVAAELTAEQNIQGLPEAPVYWIRDDISAIDDVDGDGDLDILSFDASAASITLYGNEAVEKGYSLDSLTFRTYDECWGGFRESFTDRSITLGVPCFGGRYYKAGAHAGSTMLLIDVDDDNDKDLILGDASFDELSIVYNGKSDMNWPYDSMIAYDTVFPVTGTTKAKIYNFPAAYYVDANTGFASKDLIVAPNIGAGGKNTNQIWLYRNNGSNTKPIFALQKTNFLQEWTIDFGSGATPRFLDVDADGDLDLLVAHRGEFRESFNKADRITLFKNTGDKTNAEFTQDNTFDYLGLIKDSIRDMKPAFGDLNGDGKQDMLIGDADGRLHYYQNNTTGNLSFASPVKDYMRIDVGFSAAPQIIDLDDDDLLDLVIGTGGGFINFYKNKGTKTAPQFDSLPTIDTLGNVYVNDFYWYYVLHNVTGEIIDSVKTYDFSGFAAPYIGDLDKDGERELILGSQNGKIWLFENIDNNLNGSFVEIDTFVYDNLSKEFGGIDFGFRVLPEAALLSDSADAIPVILIGNFRGGLNFLNAERDSTKLSISVPEIVEELAVNIFPNPTKGMVNITRDLQQYDGELVIHINDILGREVYYGTLQEGISNYTLSLQNQMAGVYYITLSDGRQFRTVERVSLIK